MKPNRLMQVAAIASVLALTGTAIANESGATSGTAGAARAVHVQVCDPDSTAFDAPDARLRDAQMTDG